MSLELSKKAAAVKPSSTLAITAKAKELKAQGKDVVGFGAGEPDFNTPENICNAAIDAIKSGFTKYTPASGTNELKEAISKKFKSFNYAPDQIVISNGGKHSLTNIFTALINPGDEVIIPAPFWLSYPEIVKLAGGVPVIVKTTKEQNYKLTVDDLKAAITDKTKAIVIINPNNPTGAVYPKEILEQIVQIAREHELIIFSDEIYDRLIMDGYKHTSIASLAPDVFCVTFSGLSKSHMIAGFRIGWMILSGAKNKAKGYIEGINMLSSMRLCSNVPAQSIVQTALGGYQSVNEYIQPGGRVYEQRDFIYKALNDIPGITAVKPKAAFYIFPKIDTEKFNIHNDEQFALDFLHEKQVLLVPGKGFNWNCPDHFRVVYLPNVRQLEKAMDKLKDFLSTYKQR